MFYQIIIIKIHNKLIFMLFNVLMNILVLTVSINLRFLLQYYNLVHFHPLQYLQRNHYYFIYH